MTENKSGNTLDSPRLEALRQAIEAGNTEAVKVFWEEMKAQGTPLLETIEDNNDHVQATFLWRGDEDLTHVMVFSPVVGSSNDYTSNLMVRLEDSDVWYLTRRIRRDLLTTYYFSPNDPRATCSPITDWTALVKNWRTDPLNSATYFYPADDEDPDDIPVEVSIISGPDTRPQPHVAERPHVPKGKLELHRFTSKILDNERRVWLYTPPGYTSQGEPYGLLLVFDGVAYTLVVPTPTILDNLLAEGRIPPMVAVLVHNDGATRDEELPCNPDFARFLAEELLPWVRTQAHVSHDPEKVVVAGSSYGGLASSWVAFKQPGIFGNVLSQSGDYVWAPEGDPEPGWLIRQYLEAERLPLKFYMDVGLLEESNQDGGCSTLSMNRHMRDVLRAKGYPVTYVEHSGGHDYLWWQQTLADGLITLVGTEETTEPRTARS